MTNTVKYHAQRLCHLHREEIEIEWELSSLTQLPQFASYQAVFAKFGFGDCAPRRGFQAPEVNSGDSPSTGRANHVSAMILSQIYPIENYLTPEGKPHVIQYCSDKHFYLLVEVWGCREIGM